jgi:hypothetical protein
MKACHELRGTVNRFWITEDETVQGSFPVEFGMLVEES